MKKDLEMIEPMYQSGFEPDDITYISLLGACIVSDDVETTR